MRSNSFCRKRLPQPLSDGAFKILKGIKKRFFKRIKQQKLYYILLLILLQKGERYVGSDKKWRTLKSD